jgi:hypothetical protein
LAVAIFFGGADCNKHSVPDKKGRTMSQLILSCEKTGRAFNSGFEVTDDDLRFVPPNWTARFFCRSCAKVHDFNLAKARVCECTHKCPTYGECQGCELSKLISGKTAA